MLYMYIQYVLSVWLQIQFPKANAKFHKCNFLTEVNACKPPDQPLMTNQALVSCSRDSSASCPPTHYCHIGENSLTTVCCPRRTDPCHERIDYGIGNANLIRYHYNGDQDECLPFSYKGLQGNSNNFLSMGECDAVCPGKKMN